jgi:hypothetical protein
MASYAQCYMKHEVYWKLKKLAFDRTMSVPAMIERLMEHFENENIPNIQHNPEKSGRGRPPKNPLTEMGMDESEKIVYLKDNKNLLNEKDIAELKLVGIDIYSE